MSGMDTITVKDILNGAAQRPVKAPPGYSEYQARQAIRDLIAEVGKVRAEFILSNIIEQEAQFQEVSACAL